jgi:endonuclease/exonuclease/phosphatase family metal-dependent hydrolase
VERLSKPLTIATYNVHRCIGRDHRFDPERTLSVIRDLDSDVLALQELHWRPDDALHLLNDFAAQLGYAAVAGPTLLDHTGHYGNALLTRLPIGFVNCMDLTVAGLEPRGALDVRLDSSRGALRVVATHLGLRPSERRAQIQQLLACIEPDKTAATILMGDLNEWFLWGRPLRWLRTFFKATPAPPTFPSFFPVFALDRIWIRPRHCLRELIVDSNRLARLASDHLPIRATIELAEHDNPR